MSEVLKEKPVVCTECGNSALDEGWLTDDYFDADSAYTAGVISKEESEIDVSIRLQFYDADAPIDPREYFHYVYDWMHCPKCDHCMEYGQKWYFNHETECYDLDKPTYNGD